VELFVLGRKSLSLISHSPAIRNRLAHLTQSKVPIISRLVSSRQATMHCLPLDSSDRVQLNNIAHRLIKSRRILVVTGAGISCNAGIPDFRSKDGLYCLIKHQYPNAVVRGENLFDTSVFGSEETASIFFTFMAALRRCAASAKPTATHAFIRHLKHKGKLQRCYTQNIDGLETKLGLSTDGRNADVIQLHGDINSLRCMQCSTGCEWNDEYEQHFDNGTTPICPNCHESQQRRLRAGKRATGVGSLRPNIVLYGEEHPGGELIGECSAKDFKKKSDFLLIFGTSLKVVGIRRLVREMARVVKENGGLVVFVNKTEVSRSAWKDIIDFHIQGDTDEWVADLKKQVPDFFNLQTKLEGVLFKKHIVSNIAFSTKLSSTVGSSVTFSPPALPKDSKERLPISANSKVNVDNAGGVFAKTVGSRKRAPLSEVPNLEPTKRLRMEEMLLSD
jgi:NAD-dependent histone deacetylase SIR2